LHVTQFAPELQPRISQLLSQLRHTSRRQFEFLRHVERRRSATEGFGDLTVPTGKARQPSWEVDPEGDLIRHRRPRVFDECFVPTVDLIERI
jgi:hypothetical protein